MTIATDIGVDLEAGTITIGLLSDLTGPFSPLVSAIVTGQEVYWENVNANGGINGLQVILEIRDTGYVVDNHVQMYDELKDKVVAFGHSTGSPHTVAINPMLQEDGILAIPLTWYSGWSDPAINANLLPHGAPYCIEAQNVIGWAVEQNPDMSTLAIVSLPGDYGQDSAAGAKIAAADLGLEIVYDGEGTVVPTDEAGLAAAADAIVNANPDMVWITTTPGMFGAIFGQALAKGYQGMWSGAAPTYNPAFVAPDSAIKDVVAATTFWGSYYETWSGTSAGTQEAKELLMGSRPDTTPFDFYFEGFIEAKILHEALLKAYANGDLTQAGVLAAAKSLEEVDFNGLAPNETYVGDANSIVQRVINIIKPDPEGLAAGTSGGTMLVESNYTSANAAAFEFTGACYVLGG
jgi:ABC-type branched-subunit amino acid transport system substrate-binding protein